VGGDDDDGEYGVVITTAPASPRTAEVAPVAIDSSAVDQSSTYGVTADIYPVAKVAQVAYVAPTPTYSPVDYSRPEVSEVAVSNTYAEGPFADDETRAPLGAPIAGNTAAGAATATVDEVYQKVSVQFDGKGIDYDYEALHFKVNGDYDYGIPSQIAARPCGKAERAVPAKPGAEMMVSSSMYQSLGDDTGVMAPDTTYAALDGAHATYGSLETPSTARGLSTAPFAPAADGTHANSQTTATGQTPTSVTDAQTTAPEAPVTCQMATSVTDITGPGGMLKSPAQPLATMERRLRNPRDDDDDSEPTYDYAVRGQSGPDAKIVLSAVGKQRSEGVSVVDDVDKRFQTLRRPREHDPDYVATPHNFVSQGTYSGDKWKTKKKKSKPKLEAMDRPESIVAEDTIAAMSENDAVMVWDPKRQRDSFKNW
jgi:hypothetical protein